MAKSKTQTRATIIRHNDVAFAFKRDPSSGDVISVQMFENSVFQRVYKAGYLRFYLTENQETWFYDASETCVVKLDRMSFQEESEDNYNDFEPGIVQGYLNATRAELIEVPESLKGASLWHSGELQFPWGSYKVNGEITIKPDCLNAALACKREIEAFGVERLINSIKLRQKVAQLQRRSEGDSRWTL